MSTYRHENKKAFCNMCGEKIRQQEPCRQTVMTFTQLTLCLTSWLVSVCKGREGEDDQRTAKFIKCRRK